MADNILVTGGAGFIGTNFVYYWMNKYPADQVYVLDALTYAGNKESLVQACQNSNFTFIHGNTLDQDRVETLLLEKDIAIIIHFAAESHVDRSIRTPGKFITTNVTGTHSLLEAAKNIWLAGTGKQHRFHHISTDEVYGTLTPDGPAFTEESPYKPNSPYAASKAAADHFVRSYHQTYGLNTSISYCSNNYGPFQFPEKLIPLVIINILHGAPLPVYGDGMQIRDWLHTADHCLGIDLIIKKGKNGCRYNIGANNEWTNIDLIHLLCQIIDSTFQTDNQMVEKFPKSCYAKGHSAASLIRHVQDRPGHDRRYGVDTAKIKNILGYAPQKEFTAALSQTVSWYLKNDSWWKKIYPSHNI